MPVNVGFRMVTIMVTCACSGFESKYNLYFGALKQEVLLCNILLLNDKLTKEYVSKLGLY